MSKQSKPKLFGQLGYVKFLIHIYKYVLNSTYVCFHTNAFICVCFPVNGNKTKFKFQLLRLSFNGNNNDNTICKIFYSSFSYYFRVVVVKLFVRFTCQRFSLAKEHKIFYRMKKVFKFFQHSPTQVYKTKIKTTKGWVPLNSKGSW